MDSRTVNERTRKIEAIFHAAAELDSADERQRYLDQVCRDDRELRREVEELLRSAAAAETVFQTGQNACQMAEANPELTLAEKPGDRIGRYKLLEKIGEGGMGVVYMAEQREPVRRNVALKIIKLGMDTRQVVARFEAERQALAMMNHPHIAQVLDGGATETGRPYFVMELVQGVPITQFCEAKQMAVPDRLKLFILVCQAIQSAHQKGIIHRDIKPSNVLVTMHNGAPHPMVIDFGVAKATGQKLTEKTLFTNFATMIGTPAYMSPEQAEMSKLDVDTRSDIYSLGVLLYELLTGSAPFPEERLRSVAYGEMQRIIAEEEPERPSTRLRKKAVAGSEIRNPKSEIDSDLDWIVMKCLEKDRNRRYETANGLATDIKRYLANEPVLARPPSRLYEFQKTVRRHKVGFAATGAVMLALGMGVIASVWQAKKSAREAAKATAISDFLQTMLASADPRSEKGPDYTVRQLLDEMAAGLKDQFKDQPDVEMSVQMTIGVAYQGLGEGSKAQVHLERVLALQRRHLGEVNESLALTLIVYAWSLLEQQRAAAAEEQARQAVSIYRKLGASPEQVLNAMDVLQKSVCYQGRLDEATRITRDALQIAQSLPNQECKELGNILHGMAEALEGQGTHAEAESFALRAIAMHRRFRGEGDTQEAWASLCLGRAQKGQNKLGEAESTLRQALAIFRRYHSGSHKSVGLTISALRDVLEAKGDVAAVQRLAQEELSDLAKLIPENHADAEVWRRRAAVHGNLKMWTEAAQDLEHAVELSKETNATQRLMLGGEARLLSERALPAGDLQSAERAALLSTEILQQLVRNDPKRAELRENLKYSQMQLGLVLSAGGNHDRARQVQKECFENTERAARDFPDHEGIFESLASCHYIYGQALLQKGDVEAAEQHCRRAVEAYATLAARSPTTPKYHQAEAEVSLRLASLLVELGKAREAEILISKVAPQNDAEVLNNLAWYLATWASPGKRDGRRAVAYAEQAVALTERKNPNYLDTLAAAFAQSGNFPDAVRIQQEAAHLVMNEVEKKPYLFRVSLYQEKKPYVDHRFPLESACGLRGAGKFVAAEALARECVGILEKELPASWQLFEAQSTLGGALLGQKKYAQAEPFLLSCYEGLKQQTNLFTETHQRLLKDVLRSIVQLYEATAERSPELAQWQQKLAELDPALRAGRR